MKIELLTNPKKDPGFKHTLEFIDVLGGYDCELYISPRFERLEEFREKRLHFQTDVRPDVLLVLGGDGSIIRAAHRAAREDIPMLGVNLGRVGYLAELELEDTACLASLISGSYFYEERMMLDVSVKNGEETTVYHALNDAVITRKNGGSITEFSLSCNGNSVGVYRADGLIISTPTGSTAYAMSAGGPVLDPSLQCISTVPICPQTLGARTIVFSPDSTIEVKNLCEEPTPMCLSVDGAENALLLPGESVSVKKSDMKLKLIRMKRDTKNEFSPFFDTLNKKMSEKRM